MSADRLAIVEPKPQSRDLKPGDTIQHSVHNTVASHQVIASRKDDDSGWWLTDFSGLADSAFDSYDDWQLVVA